MKKSFVGQYILLLFGNILIAGAYALICVPNKLVNGGVTALSMVISKVIGIDITVIVVFFTVALLIICATFLGKRYLLNGLFSSICYTVIFSISTHLPFKFYLHDFIAVSLASILVGIGYYCCIAAKSTTVGFDTIALILHKKNEKIKIAVVMFAINTVVLLCGLLTYGFVAVVKGIIFTFIQTYTLNFMLSRQKRMNSENS